ncbi:MAG TPA: hypothetical protein VMW83_09370 [Spirochaetia bacterium]|nr:hypothetical protein [Spirochaetia bacterium]
MMSGPALASSGVSGVSNYDLVGTPYYDSVTRLEALDVLRSVYGSYPVNDAVSRTYLAETLIRMVQLGDLVPAAEGPTKYSDVAPGSALSGEVNLLDELNIMHGQNGLFMPGATVTWSDAIRSIMSALYYGEGVNGFSDSTVVRTAGQVGLINEQGFEPRETLTMGQLALVLDNAIFEVQLPGSREKLANSSFGVQFGPAWVIGSPVTGAPYDSLIFDSQIGAVSIDTPLPLLLAPGLDVDSYLGQKVLVGVKELDEGGQTGYQVIYLKLLPQD